MHKDYFPSLDIARAAAAMLVLLGHLRAFLFVDFAESPDQSTLAKLFYFLTGFGHQAVMIFFVLSGFLIAGSIRNKIRNNQWSWSGYALRRLTRLWVVLIPTLLLTVFWDTLGQFLTDSAFYNGDFRLQYNSGPDPGGKSFSFLAFVSNVFFLQTIVSPAYGSNVPLWSLAYEFWYYLLFPLLALSFYRNTTVVQLCVSIFLIVLLFLSLPGQLLLSGIIWLMGATAVWLSDRDSLVRLFSLASFRRTSLLGFVLAMSLSRLWWIEGFTAEIAVGGSFMLVLLGVIHQKKQPKIPGRVIRVLADMSYTLYLTHFPFIAFLVCYLFSNQLFDFQWEGIVIFCAITALSLIYSFVVYWLFEKRTSRIRSLLKWKQGISTPE